MRKGAAGNGHGAGLTIVSLLAVACTFGNSVPKDQDDDGDETEGAVATSTGVPTTGNGSVEGDDDTLPSEDSTGPDDDDDADAADDDDDDADDDDDTVDCGATYHVQAWASDAAVVLAPMTVGPGWTDIDTQVAYTAQEGGTLTLVLDIPCASTHYAWGLVWDQLEGGNACGAENADSFFVAVDGGTYGTLYAYGCENCGGDDADWYWARIRDFEGAISCQDGDPFEPEFDVGTHTLSFRGRENGSFVLPEPNVAALVGVVVSNDPDFDLSTVVVP